MPCFEYTDGMLRGPRNKFRPNNPTSVHRHDSSEAVVWCANNARTATTGSCVNTTAQLCQEISWLKAVPARNWARKRDCSDRHCVQAPTKGRGTVSRPRAVEARNDFRISKPAIKLSGCSRAITGGTEREQNATTMGCVSLCMCREGDGGGVWGRGA